MLLSVDEQRSMCNNDVTVETRFIYLKLYVIRQILFSFLVSLLSILRNLTIAYKYDLLSYNLCPVNTIYTDKIKDIFFF